MCCGSVNAIKWIGAAIISSSGGMSPLWAHYILIGNYMGMATKTVPLLLVLLLVEFLVQCWNAAAVLMHSTPREKKLPVVECNYNICIANMFARSNSGISLRCYLNFKLAEAFLMSQQQQQLWSQYLLGRKVNCNKPLRCNTHGDFLIATPHSIFNQVFSTHHNLL